MTVTFFSPPTSKMGTIGGAAPMPPVQDTQVVDIAFPVSGASLPLDHGYTLFSAMSRLVPELHRQPSWGVHPVFGVRDGRTLELEPRSRIKVRMPLSEISQVMPLAGASLDVSGSAVRLGFPQVFPLTPAAHVRARLVTIRGFQEEDEFVPALRRQIAAIEDLGQDPATIDVVLGRRRILKIRDKKVVGFAVGLTGLSATASLAIQRVGLGGRRHMGAGLFVPPGRNG